MKEAIAIEERAARMTNGTSRGNQVGKLTYAADAMVGNSQDTQWEQFIASMLAKLELPKEKHKAVKDRYEEVGRHVARKLGVGDNDAHVVVQGSMKTGTTIHGDGREKFDLDIVVKLSGPKFERLRESEEFFQQFGEALEGIADAGSPKAKSRCWRLQYPGEPFYFDVTPAIPMSQSIVGTELRVRDPQKVWSPSNPEDFADWFCRIADKRFLFQSPVRQFAIDAKTTVDDLPAQTVRLDDILRRTVQLIKLHRDGYYKGLSDPRRDARPISVILVTLAAKAYDDLVTTTPHLFRSSAQVVAALVEKMPQYIRRANLEWHVDNPALRGPLSENFADRWNSDGGLRAKEFSEWHSRLEDDLEALFNEEQSKRSEARVKAVFGEFGVKAWKDSQPSDVFRGLLNSHLAGEGANPTAPRNSGSRDKLA